MTSSPITLFPNYLQLRSRSRLTPRFWRWVRAGVVVAALAYVVLLLVAPAAGLLLWWRLTVPVLPLVFLAAPGIWRNVCPLAAANQAPRRFNFTRALTPPAWFKEYGFVIGLVAFFVFASSRKWLFNYSGPASAVLILAALAGAFLGGYLFKGKSGWCSSICPLYPVQRLYNQTPFATVANAHCETCVGCTKNCYDFNPGVAYLADLYDDDRYYANYRKFFAAAMPGFILAYFLVPDPTTVPLVGWMYIQFAIYMIVSVGLFNLLDSFVKVSANKLTAVYAAAALNLFYFFGLPGWLKAVSGLFGGAAPAWLAWVLQAGLLALTLLWIARTYRKEPLFLGQLLQGEDTRIATGAARVLKQAAQGDRPALTFMPGEVRVLAEPGRTILEIAEANNQKIEAGCRMGVCGADPVVILSGMENLPAAGADEQSTLERLGLGANCRMACMCRVKGPVTLATNVREAAALAAPPAAAPRVFDHDLKRVVIIGNGIAGVTAADYVRRNHPDCEIHLVGRERHHLYNRMAITRLIYGRSAMSGLYLQPEAWYADKQITCWLNTHVTRLDRENKQVHLATGEDLAYDRLILASGSASLVPPLPGFGLPGTFVLREADEAMEIRGYVQQQQCRQAVIAGGGLLGLEAAYALHKIGLDVVVLERGEWLLRRQLDARAARLLEQYLQALGVTIVTRAETASVQGAGRLTHVTLKDGRVLPAEVFLVAIGIQPNVELARAAGLEVKRGVLVDDAMRTTAPDIFAAGDVCEFAQQVPGLWPVAVEQARVAAINATGGQASYQTVIPVTALKVVGVDMTSVGRFEAQSEADLEIALEDLEGQRYRKLVIHGGRLVGAILLGYPLEATAVTAAVKAGRDVSADLDALRAGEWQVLQDSEV